MERRQSCLVFIARLNQWDLRKVLLSVHSQERNVHIQINCDS